MLVAGGSRAAARRAAKYGLGFISQTDSPGLKEFYEAQCRANGFEPGVMQFPVPGAPTTVFVADNVDEAWDELGSTYSTMPITAASYRHGDDSVASISRADNVAALRSRPVPTGFSRCAKRPITSAVGGRCLCFPCAGEFRRIWHGPISNAPPWRQGTYRVRRPLTTPLRIVVWSTGGVGSIAVDAIDEARYGTCRGMGAFRREDRQGCGRAGRGRPERCYGHQRRRSAHRPAPDCVVYAASGPERDAAAVPDYVRLLEAGINVVSTTSTSLVYPPAYYSPEWRDQLEAAAKSGDVSFYASGIFPGFGSDQLALLLTTQSKRIDASRSPRSR